MSQRIIQKERRLKNPFKQSVKFHQSEEAYCFTEELPRKACKAYTPQRRVQILTESLKEKADAIASIRAETLNEKCSELHIPTTQHTVLRQIMSAAST